MTVRDEQPIRILYIDDDPGLARLVQRALAQKGYVVEHAASGSEGLQRLQDGDIDIVALDHHMPGQTGLDVLPQILGLPERPPVIYVTGSEDSRIAVAALKAGAIDYVWKDVQGHFRELLVEAIETSLDKERLRRAKQRADEEVREARDRAELSLREVNHRVANSLALVATLARMQAMSLADPAARQALREMEARVIAIAGVHRRLYTSNDVRVVQIDEYLASLVEDLQTAMRAEGREHTIRLAAEPIRLATDKAVSLGVIVTELVTNAYKYAYPEGVRGEIRVLLKAAGEGQAALIVEDDGIGMPAGESPQGTGLGTRVVGAMAKNLGATLDLDPMPRGTRLRLTFPL